MQDPVGSWDPAGFTADGSMENFARRRQTELKHGRVSILASTRLSGDLSPSAGLTFAAVLTGPGATSIAPIAGWAHTVAHGASRELSQD